MLDIGTGTGRMLELFADRYERALGVDLSPAMLAVARANLERAGVAHARVRIGDGTNLPVVRDSFDLVVIHQVLQGPDKIERDLMRLVPKKRWFDFTYVIIDHGRAICVARTPRCADCPVSDLCPSSLV